MARRAEAERERRADVEAEETKERTEHGGPSKVKLALGAAGLLLFILGVRRTFHTEDGSLGGAPKRADEEEPEAEESGARRTAAR